MKVLRWILLVLLVLIIVWAFMFLYKKSKVVETVYKTEVATTTPFGPPNVALKTVVTAVGVLIVSGALGGIMPAAHAASIKPIEALRTE